MESSIGKQSIRFQSAPTIVDTASVVGVKEGEGPLANCFDYIGEDDLFLEETWEEAESKMQKIACEIVMKKARINPEDIRYLFGGDLLRQGIATTMGAAQQLEIPLFGLFGACSTSGEALALSAMTVAGGYANQVLAITSSHFASAEKEFRFPLGYANQRPKSSQWTVTGSGAFLVGRGKGVAKITGVTIGKIIDWGLKDSQNMGACMAPAAADTLQCHFTDFDRKVEDYDQIVTGDLGEVGTGILYDLMKDKHCDIRGKHMDCGKMIFEKEAQKTNAGGSGCGCAAVTLASYVLPKVKSGEWNRVLFLPTGALMSTVSYNEGQSVPGISHGIVIENFE